MRNHSPRAIAESDTNENGLPFEEIAGERRTNRRYQLRLELHWKILRRRRVLYQGEGWTLDMSSGGVRFTTSHHLPIGAVAELSVIWPAAGPDSAPMRLLIAGKIVRSGNGSAAVRTTRHEILKAVPNFESQRDSLAGGALFRPARVGQPATTIQ